MGIVILANTGWEKWQVYVNPSNKKIAKSRQLRELQALKELLELSV